MYFSINTLFDVLQFDKNTKMHLIEWYSISFAKKDMPLPRARFYIRSVSVEWKQKILTFGQIENSKQSQPVRDEANSEMYLKMIGGTNSSIQIAKSNDKNRWHCLTFEYEITFPIIYHSK